MDGTLETWNFVKVNQAKKYRKQVGVFVQGNKLLRLGGCAGSGKLQVFFSFKKKKNGASAFQFWKSCFTFQLRPGWERRNEDEAIITSYPPYLGNKKFRRGSLFYKGWSCWKVVKTKKHQEKKVPGCSQSEAGAGTLPCPLLHVSMYVLLNVQERQVNWLGFEKFIILKRAISNKFGPF